MGVLGTRSVLFTDLVGSTELRVRLGEDRADALQRRHDAQLSRAIESCGGKVVKGLGDGILATFDSAADAVTAAVEIEQAVLALATADPDERFEVRIGISVGDVAIEGGDVFGTAVVEASRLCGSAAGGEILVADLVRALSRGRGGFVFEPVGELALKGLPEPVTACRVAWTPPEDRAGLAPIPPRLVGSSSMSYVGRGPVLAHLRRTWERAALGGSTTVLLAGEPGVGKTRTAAEASRVAHQAGALVLYGRCEEGLAAPYQPFVEALDHHTEHVPELRLGRLPGELARLLPDLASRVPGLPAPVGTDPRAEEHRLLEAVASWLVEASRPSGLVLVVDDLQWATKPTLLMLLHLARTATAAEGARLLVIGTYRDTDLEPEHPFATFVGDVSGVDGTERIALTGLSGSETQEYLRVATGHELDEDGLRLARLLREQTEGNPFFVGEVLRHLIETGAFRRERDRWVIPNPDRLAVPQGVRDVVGRRLARLSDVANHVLTVAAVVGRDIAVDVLCVVAEEGEDVVIDALDEALRARLVEETGADQYRFAHALVCTTLYDRLSATRVRRLHRRAATAIEKLRPADLPALAYHFVEGGPEDGDNSRAIHYTLAAAAQSLDARANPEAEARYRTALELLDDSGGDLGSERLDAMIGLGEALRDQGNPTYRTVLLEAARGAEATGDTARLVRAVLANTRGTASIIGGLDEQRVALVEAALALMGDEPTPERAKLLAHLAGELATSDASRRGFSLLDEALQVAEQLRMPELTAQLYTMGNFAAFAPERAGVLPDRLAQAVEAADASADPGHRVWSRIWWSRAVLRLGDLTAAWRVAAEALEIAEVEGFPFLRWVSRANAVAPRIARGDLAGAQAANDEALAIGAAAGEPDAEMWWVSLQSSISLMRDEPGVLAEATGRFADELPGAAPQWRAGQAVFLAEAGRLDEARRAIDEHGLDASTFADTVWSLMGPALLAECAYLLDDAELASRCVVPLAAHPGHIAHYFLGIIGTTDHYRGRCLAVLGDLDGAAAAYESSIAHYLQHGAVLHAAFSRWPLVEALVRRRAPGDLERAQRVHAEALEVARRCGADGLVQRLSAALA